jgi:hypothetical protein
MSQEMTREGDTQGNTPTGEKEGWTYLLNAPKWHYFVGGRSLCRRWALFSTTALESGNDDSTDNCKSCRVELEKRRAKQQA